MKNISGKTVLVTGGTGSFGNKVLRYLLETTDAKESDIHNITYD
jgi:FlaA1/EpsC-like NDP-sugar epimerase